MGDRDFERQLKGYSLTTAVISYYFPDAPTILNPNTFTWQEYDVAPRFPKLLKFLHFWTHNLDGTLAEVRIAHSGIVKPLTIRHIGTELHLN